MSVTGGCRCGAIRYLAAGEPEHSTLCHCADCRRSAGAPVVGWAMFAEEALAIEGSPRTYESSPGTFRQFCATCGSGLFYRNAALFPGKVDVQTGTLDDANALPPVARIQVADAGAWWHDFAAMPTFDRFPG